MSTKKSIILVTVLLAIIALAVAVAINFDALSDFVNGLANGDNSDDGNTDGTGNGGTDGTGDGEMPSEGLVLIWNKQAKFNVVLASGAGSGGVRAANRLIEQLRSLGISVNDTVSDSDEALITDCEIIIGTNCRNRGEELQISNYDLGADGYVIKQVGTRIVIAGGSPKVTRDTIERFTAQYLGIPENATTAENVVLNTVINEEKYVERDIESLLLGTNDIKDYSIVCDMADQALLSVVYTFRETLAINVGAQLEIVDIDKAGGIDKQIRFASIPLSLDEEGNRTYADGFYVRMDGNDLVIESEYPNAFVKEFDTFVLEYITSKKGNVVIPGNLNYSACASIVKYSDFGAVGDGVADDFPAIKRAHEYANMGGQLVVADGEAYYIGLGSAVDIMSDVDFGTARIIIDDNVAGLDRSKPVFRLAREYPKVELSLTQLESIDADKTLKKLETTSIPWLKDYLEAPSLVVVHNGAHMDYVRYGNNANNGNVRMDILLVDKDGNIDPTTPVTFEFEQITRVEIFRVDDAPITVKGGFFESLCAAAECSHTEADGCYRGKTIGGVKQYCIKNVYNSVRRGIRIERSNSTLLNIDHKMVDEPLDGSFPYYGFLLFYNANNVLAKDCNLTGHKTYVENKTNSNNETNWVSMGSYDFVVEYSNNIRLDGITQANGKNDIGDSGYWGIMSSNGAKNLDFKNCVISRIDAHRGFWNMSIDNTKIGHTFNVIGGGKLTVKNTERRVGQSFIRLRDDYGATFEGDLYIENCLLDGITAYDTVNGGATGRPSTRYSTGYIVSAEYYSNNTKYLTHDFGYRCYMPINVTIVNFKSNCSGTTYVYNALNNKAFDTSYSNYYVLTESITYITDNTITLPDFLEGKSYTTSSSKFPIASGGTILKGVKTENKTKN